MNTNEPMDANEERLIQPCGWVARAHGVRPQPLNVLPKWGKWLVAGLLFASAFPRLAHSEQLVVELAITTPLKFRNVPLDPKVDFPAWIRRAGVRGVLDPNSIQIWNSATNRRVPHALTDDFHYSDKGRVEFVVADPRHRRFEVRFRTLEKRRSLQPAAYVPPIGVGDLLRFNAGRPQPITMFFSMGLHDLTGDGIPDLVGTWNYAYRPGVPWDGVICYPRLKRVPGSREGRDRVPVKRKSATTTQPWEFGDLYRIRYRTSSIDKRLHHFKGIYISATFGDLNKDGRPDLAVARPSGGKVRLLLNTGERDHAGMPIFELARTVSVGGWTALRIVDLNGDGAQDFVVDGTYVRNSNPRGWPFTSGKPVRLAAGKQPCFIDVDQDGRLDAVTTIGGASLQPNFYRFGWKRNLGGDPPKFGPTQLIRDINVQNGCAVSAFRQGSQSGLIVQHHAFQQVTVFGLRKHTAGRPRFDRLGRAESLSAVMSLGDQAWPHLCDWDADGDLDMLIGGGYGWPRIVMNEGSLARPKYAEPRFIQAAGKPIRFVRNEILGKPESGHDMGYPYPVFVDWDMDGLRDLVCPNETNRIYWYKNVGTKNRPRFGERRQVRCDGFPDSPALRRLSAKRAADPKSDNGIYPSEPNRPFQWRTGAAIADFNGDGLPDLVTDDCRHGQATLFVQYRAKNGKLRLRRHGVLTVENGTPIDHHLVKRRVKWSESFRAIDWDKDGRMDLLHCLGGSHHGIQDNGSMYLLRNVGSKEQPVFAAPQTIRCFGEPIRITNHGPHAWVGDYDGDGTPDIVACVEWSVYPLYRHAALMMKKRPTVRFMSVKRR